MVDPGVKDGGRLSLLVEAAEEAAFELAAPEGTTKLHVGSAVGELDSTPPSGSRMRSTSVHVATPGR